MASIKLQNVTKTYEGGETIAVENMNIEIKDGEFFVLLGPSGCGKTTTLNCISGLIRPDEGEVWIGDEKVTDIRTEKDEMVKTQKRDVAMVFQDFALYPNMTVSENMEFPLENLGFEKEERKEKVRETAELLGIEDLADRKPADLSGGQRQRVALGRAIVRDPSVFLFDEPLANLDAKLRVRMRSELKELQKELGVTTVYVTHNQTEAMTMADRIMLLREGKALQVGTPDDLFYRPVNRFAAGFIGTPPMNLIECNLREEDGKLRFATDDFSLAVPSGIESELRDRMEEKENIEVILGIRPSTISEGGEGETSSDYAIEGEVSVLEPMGTNTLIHMDKTGHRITAEVGEPKKELGERTTFKIDPEKIHVFDKETKNIITHASAYKTG